MDTLLLQYWWLGLLLWTVSGTSDYYLTIWGARLYVQSAKHYIEVEGSYEMFPLLEKDINTQRMVSPRFLVILVAGGLVIGLSAKFRQSLKFDDATYLFIAGALLLVQVPIHLRHIGNIVRFKLMGLDSEVEGKIKYSRWFVLRISSVDFFAFAGVLLLAFLASRSWFVLGGCIRCFGFGAYFHWKSKRERVRAKRAVSSVVKHQRG